MVFKPGVLGGLAAAGARAALALRRGRAAGTAGREKAEAAAE